MANNLRRRIEEVLNTSVLPFFHFRNKGNMVQVPDLDDYGNVIVTLYDSTGNPVIINGGINTISQGTVLGDGRKVTAGVDTPIRLTATHTYVKAVLIQALVTNTKYVVFGGQNVDVTEATRTGVALAMGDAAPIGITDLYEVWISSEVAGEGVSYTYIN